jgi:hypothetical protein
MDYEETPVAIDASGRSLNPRVSRATIPRMLPSTHGPLMLL